MSGVFASLAISVKWTGGTFLALIVILYFISWLKSQNKNRDLIRGAACLVVAPAMLYFTIFAIHFSLLNKSGPGDAFMTPEFRKTLVGSNDYNNENIESLSIFKKFTELNMQMYKSNATLTAGHPYSSKWYTWPFMIRPIYYWNGSTPSINSGQANSEQVEPPQTQSRIYLLGNPAIWWLSTIAILYLLISAIQNLYQKTGLQILPTSLIGAYLINILPFIGISRAMFLYHYFTALIFAVLTLVYLIDNINNKKWVFTIILSASLASFIFFAPLSYGLKLNESTYNWRVWLNSWL